MPGQDGKNTCDVCSALHSIRITQLADRFANDAKRIQSEISESVTVVLEINGVEYTPKTSC